MRPLDKETFKHPSILLPGNIVNMYICNSDCSIRCCMKMVCLLFYLNYCFSLTISMIYLRFVSRAALCDIMVTRLRRIHQIEHCHKYYFSAQSQKKLSQNILNVSELFHISCRIHKTSLAIYLINEGRKWRTSNWSMKMMLRSSLKCATVNLNVSINPVGL